MGTGSIAAARWTRDSDLCLFHGRIVFGTAGVNAGSGTYRLRLPARAVSGAASEGGLLGRGYCVRGTSPPVGEPGDVAGATRHLVFRLDGPAVDYAVADVYPAGLSSQRTMTDQIPWTWDVGDSFHWSLSYEASE